jgi:hypothetical protein
MHYGSNSEHWEETLLAFEQEVLREAAEKIRADLAATGDWTCCAEARSASADLIDPDKEPS